jgi:hypothetical protein
MLSPSRNLTRANFESRDKKRSISTQQMDMVGFWEKWSHSKSTRKHILSLTGPALHPHLAEFFKIFPDAIVHIVEKEYSPFQEIQAQYQTLQDKSQVDIHFGDIQDYIRSTQCPVITLADIDFCKTFGVLDREFDQIQFFIDLFKKMHTQLSYVFLTYSMREQHGTSEKFVREGFQTLVKEMGWVLKGEYIQSYRDGPPMITAAYMLSRINGYRAARKRSLVQLQQKEVGNAGLEG